MKPKEWTTAASERCRRAKERQEREAEAARERELAALRAQARQKPPTENAVDCTPYLDDADIARQRRAHLRYAKLQQDQYAGLNLATKRPNQRSGGGSLSLVTIHLSPITGCKGNGEGGIRTLGTLLGYGALAKRCFRPLSHLTN